MMRLGWAVLASFSLIQECAAACATVDELRLQLQWVSQPQFAGFEVPNSMDGRLPSYADACLDVKVLPSGVSWTPLNELASRRVDVAMSDGMVGMAARNSGINLTLVYHTMRRNPYRLVGTPSSHVTPGFKGTRVGVWCCGLDFTIKNIMMLTPNSTPVYSPQGFTISPLLTGQVDLASAMVYNEMGRVLETVNPATNYLYQFEELTVINPDTFGVPELHTAMFVLTERLEELRPKLTRFLRVVNQAWLACRDNEDLCVQATYAGDKPHFTYMMREINKLNFPSPQGLGVVPRSEYESLASFAVSYGVFPSAPTYDEMVDTSIALAAGALEDPRVSEDYAPEVRRLCAPYGTSEYRLCIGYENTLCRSGTSPSGPLDGNCSLCSQGRFSLNPMSPVEARMLTCEPCTPGRFSSTTGASLCDLCAAGNYSEDGFVECRVCPAGSATDNSRGAPACTICPAGRYAENDGAADCSLCEQGSYQDELGSKTCISCPAGTTTILLGATSPLQCVCKRGTRLVDGECVACIEGMICEVGQTAVTIQPGYFADVNLEIFRCYGKSKRCIGGLPGSTCASGRTGIACGDCIDGYSEDGDNGRCIPCESKSVAGLVCVLIAGVLVLIGIYYTIDTQDFTKNSQTAVQVGMSFSLFATVLQQLSVVKLFSIEWPEPLKTLMQALSIFSFDLQDFKVSCMTQTSSSVKIFIMKLAFIVFWFLILTVIHICFVLWRKSDWKESMRSFQCCIGTIFLIVYISIVSSVLGPFRCLPNPSGRWTVSDQQVVVCWEGGGHSVLIAVSVVAMLGPLCFMLWCVYIIKVFPLKMQKYDTKFLRQHAFLFARYRPDLYWYSLVHICRSLSFTIASILPGVVSQLFVSQLITSVNTVFVALTFPWRTRFANAQEILVSASLGMVLEGATFFVHGESLQPIAVVVSLLMTAMVIGIFFGVIVGCIKMVLGKFMRQGHNFDFFLTHHKAKAGSFARLLKYALSECPSVQKHIFLDSDDLVDLDRLFDYVRNQTRTLVILCTSALFTRPWCVGEVVVAMDAKVGRVLVTWPDYTTPDEAFILDFEKFVPDISCLVSRGVGLEEVQKMLRGLQELPIIQMRPRLSAKFLSAITDILASGAYRQQDWGKSVHIDEVDHADSLRTTSTVILVDYSNIEAVSAGIVLARLMQPHFMANVSSMPELLPEHENPQPNVSKIILICSSSMFESVMLLTQLDKALEVGAKYALVFSDESFQVPTEKDHHKIQVVADSAKIRASVCLEITNIFSSIAVPFYSSRESHAALVTQATQVVNRLMEKDFNMRSLTNADSKKAHCCSSQVVSADENVPQAVFLGGEV